MDEDKFKYKIIYCLRRKCPLCRHPYVYFCLRCVFVLVSRGHTLYRHAYYSRKLYSKSYALLNEYIQGAFRLVVVLYLYHRIYRRLNFLAPKDDSTYKYKYTTHEKSWVSLQHYNKLITLLKERRQLLLLDISRKDTQNKTAKQIQEITRKSQNDHPNNPSTVASSCSIKSKRSTNLLSAFVKRARRRKSKTQDIIFKNVSVSTHNLNFVASNSSLGIHTEEEIEINVENYGKKISSNDNPNGRPLDKKGEEVIVTGTDSNHSILSAGKIRGQFFKKFMKRQSPMDGEKKKSEHNLEVKVSKPNILEPKKSPKICQSESCKDITKMDKGLLKNTSGVPTSFINFRKSMLSGTLSSGLQSVQELTNRFRESESHLIQILSRYVKDANFQKELLDTLSQHSKLQWEAERRTSALANDMWMHQIEIGRAQERTLQETLNSLVKQNRQLQIDNEIMFRKHEKLVRKLRSFPEMGVKYKCVDCESQMDNIMKHNEKLQGRLDAFTQQLDNLEHELHSLQRQNDCLEEQLRLSTGEIHNLKATLHRSKTDYEMEIASLNYKLQNAEEAIKKGLEAGDILMEDIERVKRQCRNLPFTINWAKINTRAGSLADIIHVSRSCINEISKEMICFEAQLALKEKDIESLQETNTKLQENLKKSATELNNLSKRMDENSSVEIDKKLTEQKCKILESDLKSAQEQLQKLSMNHDKEKSSLLETIANYESLSHEMSEKNKTIDQTKVFVSNITSENLALRKQIEALHRMLSQSGAGDVAKELATCQEQIAYFQSQYYELLNERQRHLDEIDRLEMDKTSILEHQEENYKGLQTQVQNLDKINKENNALKQQLESEHQTVLSLQGERMKYLEEKNMLKTIFQHMKAEITRVQKLESAVFDISKEASKLALVAEYNKQVGEKLKSEVIEKDQTINKLRTSVEKLNDIQVQNTKEKLSLCYELSEVCQMKEKLSSILSLEVKKNMALDDSKRELLESASTQLRKFEDLQKSGRSALKEVLHDYKISITQRDTLVKEKERLLKELSELKSLFNEELKKSSQRDRKIAELTAKGDEDQKAISILKVKVQEELSMYTMNIKQLEKLIRQLRKDKIDLEESVRYLQNNIQRLHCDLNESRKCEKEAKDELNKCLQEKEAIEREKQHWEKNYDDISNDKDKLVKEINYLNSLCEKVLVDFEASIKSSMEKEEMFKNEIRESKGVIVNHAKEIERLNKIVFSNQSEMERVKEECGKLRKHEICLNERIKYFEKQTIEAKEKQTLEDCLSKTKMEYDTTKNQLQNLKKEIQSLQKQLNAVLEQREEDYSFYKNHMDELLKKNEELQVKSKKELGELKISLNDVIQKLNHERAAYATLSEIHKDVSAKYLKSIKDVVDEKNVRQEMETKLKDSCSSLEQLRSEKADLQQQINILLDGLNDEKNRINVLIQEKDIIQKFSDDLQKKYNDLLAKCLSLENQMRSIELNVTESSEKIISKFQEQIDRFKNECQENHELILTLKENIGKLQQQITGLEFQKSEMTLRLHETQRKFETEEGLCEQLKNTHKLILAAVLKMQEEGKVDPSDVQHVLNMTQNAGNGIIVDNDMQC